ncbi:MAG TPA: TetR/AcrR family transcriptional regulator [Devosiaceae bacterium]|jgi:AcrR family transcriptional regulator|nr:TetR/AcrR family transcriptional regulator [Devosiaceae bacterium]
MAGRPRITREAIIGHARRIVAEHGTAGLTFQAVAAALGVSKQAIIYWYPSKWELVRDIAVPGLKAEADATIAAIGEAGSAADAIERFLRALVDHHLADLGGFRMLYLASQFDSRESLQGEGRQMLNPIHETTSSMYAALAAKIVADTSFLADDHPRRLAMAVHMAGIGLLTMLALAESVEDPLAHQTGPLVDSMVALLTHRPATS